MSLDGLLYKLSFGALFVATVVTVLVAIELGALLGRWSRARKKMETDTPVGTMVGAMLGLLAFILAFTFQMAASQFDARRVAVLKESNAIGTAYLRADFIPEPARSEIKSLFREYVDIRIAGVEAGKFEASVVHSERILGALWARVSAFADQNTGSPFTALFVSALNEVIDVHSERLTIGMRFRIPGIIWIALFFVTFFSMMAVGYQFGIDGARSVVGTLVIALTFSAVMVLIADLDSPRKGMIKVSQSSMIELQKSLAREDSGRFDEVGHKAASANVPSSDQK